MEQFEGTPELSDKEIEQIIFLSYMFSQGSIPLQKAIMGHIAKIAGLQDPGHARTLYDSFAQSLHYTEGEGYTIGRANLHTNEGLDNPKGHFSDIAPFTEGERSRDAMSLQEIVDNMWSLDYHYLCEKAGRPNRKESGFKVDTLQDPYFSFGMAYLESEKETPSEVFNTFLNRLREYDISPDNRSVKDAVIAAYQEHHSDSA